MVKAVNYKASDDMWVITGLEEAVLKKARELIQIDPDMPKGARDGLLYYEYQGHFLTCDTHSGQQFWEVQAIDGSKLPKELEGSFTHRTLAHKAIDQYGDPQAKENGRLAIERKRKKREQEKLNGTRVTLPKEEEEHSILEKTFLEAERRNEKREASE